MNADELMQYEGSWFELQLEELKALAERDKNEGDKIGSLVIRESCGELGLYEGDTIHFKRISSINEIPNGAIVACGIDEKIYFLNRNTEGIVLKEVDGDKAFLVKTQDIETFINAGGIQGVAFCIIKHLPEVHE